MAGTSETLTRPTTRYALAGTLLEVCSCGVLCPCFIGEDPDGGTCAALVAYHLDRGEIDGVDVSGLTIANIAQIPGNALQGGWRVVVVIDANASDTQRRALLEAFGGELGGPLADLAGLVEEIVAVETASITHMVDRAEGMIRIDGMVEAELEPISPQETPTTMRDTAFSTVPGAPAYMGKASRFEVDVPQHGMTWTFEGHNAVQTAWQMEHQG